MKPFFVLPFFVGLIGAFAAESDSDVQWYNLSIAGRGDVVATCDLTPSELSDSLADNQYIRLDHFHEITAEGKWRAVAPPFTRTQYVRADIVKSFSPMSGRPQDVEMSVVKP